MTARKKALPKRQTISDRIGEDVRRVIATHPTLEEDQRKTLLRDFLALMESQRALLMIWSGIKYHVQATRRLK
jgi:hypothetical protein